MANATVDIWALLQSQDQPVSNLLARLDKEAAERHFYEFVQQAWPIVEPGRPLIWGWHLQTKCEHLQAVYNFTVPEEVDPQAKLKTGIQNLIINEPPRCSKSLFTSVLFNAWVWTKWPAARFLCITYSDDLAQRDALKTRLLIGSNWYQSRWPLPLSEDQHSKSRFNVGTQGGFRVSTTILGMATGEGGDFRLIDDPHNVKKALSDVERQQANNFMSLTLPTRVVDPLRSSTVICMQRLHQDDVTGRQLSDPELGYDHLCLPMEYETKVGNQCSTKLGFVDPRTKEGELLHPARWSKVAVEKAKRELRMELGEYGVNSQFQQRPTPLGGGMFKPDNILLLPDWPPLSDMSNFVRYWDKAGSEGTGAYTAGALMAKRKSTQRTVILDVVRGQWGTDVREQTIQQVCHQDKARLGKVAHLYQIRIEQEPGSGGKDSAVWTVRETLKGLPAQMVRKTDSKATEWAPWATQVNLGGVEMVVGPWNNDLKKEMEAAPFGKYKDQLDATSGAFKVIWMGPSAGVIC